MKFEVIKSFAGIEVGAVIEIAPDKQTHMLEKGYVKMIAKEAKAEVTKKKVKLDPIEQKNK